MHTLIRRVKLGLRPHMTLENGVLILALVIALSFLWTTMQALQRNYMLQQQVNIMQQEAELMELENQTLEFQQKYYQSAEYLELSAKQRLNKAAPGEKVIILPPAPSVGEEQEFQRIQPDSKSNFERWIHFFFGDRTSVGVDQN